MGFSGKDLRRAASAFMTRGALLSGVFTALVLIAVVAEAQPSFSRLHASLVERAGLMRIRDAQSLLGSVMNRQVVPGDPAELAKRVDRVLAPYGDGITVTPAVLDAVAWRWHALQKAPTSDAALASLAMATSELISKISDASLLTYDEDVDAINLGDAYAAQLPNSIERASHAAAVAKHPATSLTFADRLSIGRLIAQAEVSWAIADNDFELGVEATTIDVEALTNGRKAAAVAFFPLQKRLNAIADHPTRHDASFLLRDDRTFLSAARTYSDAIGLALDGLMARRIAAERRAIALIALLGLVAIVLGLASIAQISRGLIRRERGALQIEKDRACALENELARQQAERQKVLNEAQFRTIFDGSPLGIATIGRDGKLLERNQAMIAMLDDSFDLFDGSFNAKTFARLLAGDLPPHQIEREVRTGAGLRWIDLTVFPICISGGDSVAAIAMIADVTDRKSLSEQLRFDATHDALTGLYSRGAFLDALTHISGTHGNGRSRQAVMLIDLDRFKIVNDTLGHAAGDDVLVIVAKRLLEIVRPADILARLHGDEFALLVTAVDEPEIARIAERVQHAIRAPIVVEGHSVCIDSSIGICNAESIAGRPDELLRNADTAMYHAKRMGRGRAVNFDGTMHEALAKYVRLASEMLPGLERGEFRVAYQPIVALSDATTRGFEALLRWQHPELGEISPVEFIPIAEETGAIQRLGRFVLGEACRQIACWEREGRSHHAITMSVNLSAHQLEESIVADVERSLLEAGIPGERLILEITESALLESGPRTSDILDRLRSSGARLCLDDFGIGYSSLRYLQQFPIDVLKIDRSFVCGADGELASEPIVRMLINLATSLGLVVVAEGIETDAQNDHLIALGCKLGQGFRFSPASSPEHVDFDKPLGKPSIRLPVRTGRESRAVVASALLHAL